MNKKNSNNLNVRLYRYLVSLDSHKRTYFLKIVDVTTEDILFNSAVTGSINDTIAVLQKLKLPPKSTQVIYEAGALGYHPYWRLQEEGYSCLIIAPSTIPQNNRLHKSDKGDAQDNLKYHRAGILRYVSVPDKDMFYLREMNRYRDTLVDNIRKKKQIIGSFTLRNGHIFDGAKTEWCNKHRQWLETLPLPATLKVMLRLMLDDLQHMEAHLADCEKKIHNEITARPEIDTIIRHYEIFPGIGTVTAQTIAFEFGDMKRFGKANQVARYIGVTPGMQQSASKNPNLSITKEGNAFARRMVISASKYYGDLRCLYSAKELAAMPQPQSEFLKRMQDRLFERYRYLKKRNIHTNKVRCAVARELVMFLWEFSVKVIPTLENATEPVKAAA
jgi:transposase